jgi:hypothetical protein
MKYYRNESLSDLSWQLTYWRDELLNMDIDHIILNEQKRDFGSGEMWCSEWEFFVEKGDGSCGKYNCKQYDPLNGKSGRCRMLSNSLIDTGRRFILRRNKRLRRVKVK